MRKAGPPKSSWRSRGETLTDEYLAAVAAQDEPIPPPAGTAAIDEPLPDHPDPDDLDDLMEVCKILSATGDAVEVHRKITGAEASS
mgnify:CR=1 FL=1